MPILFHFVPTLQLAAQIIQPMELLSVKSGTQVLSSYFPKTLKPLLFIILHPHNIFLRRRKMGPNCCCSYLLRQLDRFRDGGDV